MSVSELLRPEMGPTILAHLGKMQELPKFGVLAGQAVASAIDDLFGIGGGVYNDLDVFLPISGKYSRSERDANPFAQRITPETIKKQYGGVAFRHLELVQTYRIAGVKYNGLVNRIYFQLPVEVARCSNHAQRIISGFDINSVRVGIDLETKKLVWDAHFEQFLNTRELRIAACYTPAHSLIRLLKKSQELPNVTLDIETAARITGMLQSEGLYRMLSSCQLASYLFGEKFAKLAKTFSGRLLPYYKVEDAWRHKTHLSESWKPGSGDETSADAKLLHRVTARGSLDASDEAFATALGEVSVVALPTHVYRQRDQRTQGFFALSAAPAAPVDVSHTHLGSYAKMCGNDYFLGLENPVEDLRAVAKFAESGNCLMPTKGWSAREQLAFVKSLCVADGENAVRGAVSVTNPISLSQIESIAKERPAEECLDTTSQLEPLSFVSSIVKRLVHWFNL